MAVVQEVPDEDQAPEPSVGYSPRSGVFIDGAQLADASTDGLRQRIPLTHPSAVRDRKGTTEPLLKDLSSPVSDDRSSLKHHHHHHHHEDEISEDEEPGWPEIIFDTATMTMPFVFLFLLLDVLVHLQYQHRPTWQGEIDNLIKAIPTLGFIVYFTTTYASHALTNPLLLSASILSGSRLIWLVNKGSWGIVTDQAPAVGTLWILTIVQLPLGRAVIALAGVVAFTWWKGLKIKGL